LVKIGDAGDVRFQLDTDEYFPELTLVERIQEEKRRTKFRGSI